MAKVGDIFICFYVGGDFDILVINDFVIHRNKIHAIMDDGKGIFAVPSKMFAESPIFKVGEL